MGGGEVLLEDWCMWKSSIKIAEMNVLWDVTPCSLVWLPALRRNLMHPYCRYLP